MLKKVYGNSAARTQKPAKGAGPFWQVNLPKKSGPFGRFLRLQGVYLQKATNGRNRV